MKNSTLIIGAIAVSALAVGGFFTVNYAVDLKNASENEKKYAPYIAAMEDKHNIPKGLLHRLLKQESAFRTDIITGKKKSSVGALGIAQFMPATAREWLGSESAALNPQAAIPGAARYLKWLYTQTGNWQKAVAAYNWGIGNVKNKGLAYAPSETKNYVKSITGVTV